MEIQDYLKKKKNLYEAILKFIDESDDINDSNFKNLGKLFKEQKISENQSDLTELFHLLTSITNNHHRANDFWTKIHKIILYFKNEIKQFYSTTQIINIFKDNKRILYQLFQENAINFDEFNSENDEIKNLFFSASKNNENDELIHQLIQNDLIDEFISYVNQNSISLSTAINSPKANPFFVQNNKLTLIEFAAFFGSIQIFKYLILEKVKLTSNLWICAIHGRNSEIIHLLEENNIQPIDKTYFECLIESIKCHHNEIADYIQNNFIHDLCIQKVFVQCLESFNFYFLPIEIDIDESLFFDLCCYGYASFVKILLKTQKLNVNKKIVRIKKKLILILFYIILFSCNLNSFF